LSFYTVIVSVAACCGSISFGYANSIISTTLAQPSFLEYMGLNTAHNATELLSATNGLYYAGACLGALAGPYISDQWGRKWGLAFASVILIISAAFMAGSVNIAMFLVFRFWSGFGAFGLLMSIPVYISEIAPPRIRAGIVDLHGVFFNLGFAFACWVGYGFYCWPTHKLVQWRPPLAFQALFPSILVTSLLFMPESPRWLALKGQNDKALKILKRLHESLDESEDSFVMMEFYQIKRQAAVDSALPGGFLDLFRRPSYRKRTFVGAFTNSITQCSGVLVINAYGPIIYSMLGFDTSKQIILAGCWVSVAAFVNFWAMFFVDRFSRPKFIAVGLILCAATLSVEEAIVSNFVPSDNHDALNAGVATMFIFVVFYSFFIDGSQFAYIPEVFPNHLRAKGSSFAIFCGGLVDLILTQCAPTAFKDIGWKYYLVFIITTTCGAVLMWITFPDTNRKPLEEIAALFGD
ncbi:general substrate transporter, partial [Leptodontidium sp. 2 PMI_412]